ncbi:hypothetical protein C8R44DRAFT_723520 [Mycena epipterygia]|nr:hypothetical protein C8R44DRAFT_723520 [Mycena epipterygia]
MAVTGESTIHRLRKFGKRHKFDTPSCVKWTYLAEMVWTPVKRTRASKNTWCDFSRGPESKALYGAVYRTARGEEGAATIFEGGIRMEIKFGKKERTRDEVEEPVGLGNFNVAVQILSTAEQSFHRIDLVLFLLHSPVLLLNVETGNESNLPIRHILPLHHTADHTAPPPVSQIRGCYFLASMQKPYGKCLFRK